MGRKKHAAEGSRRKEAKKDCIRCGTELDLSGTTDEPKGDNVEHVRDGKTIAVTAEPREFDIDPHYVNPKYYEGGTYCKGCNSSIENKYGV
jgi:hypothetical protein